MCNNAHGINFNRKFMEKWIKISSCYLRFWSFDKFLISLPSMVSMTLCIFQHKLFMFSTKTINNKQGIGRYFELLPSQVGNKVETTPFNTIFLISSKVKVENMHRMSRKTPPKFSIFKFEILCITHYALQHIFIIFITQNIHENSVVFV